jgi:redox-sensitive bicupin YhaK (pirin superfamily)
MERAVISVRPQGFVWETDDPFLFCVHHDDAYPAGNERMGPAASLAGRALGSDFEPRDGWRMYHGREVPGFPSHPHRGFETVTLVRRGLIDHSDSLGAAARFGQGDVQWLTAGRGIVHAEMFPLVHRDAPNPVELFQLWLNLPSDDKMAAPHFEMFWADDVGHHVEHDAEGRRVDVTVVAGALGQVAGRPPPPASWASRADAHVAIWVITLAPGARWRVPAAVSGVHRTIYPFRGAGCQVDGRTVAPRSAVKVRPDVAFDVQAGAETTELLLLQGRPIGQPVAQHGPFVMNTPAQLRQAFVDYQATQFGGWPWGTSAPVHAREAGRFARYPDGTERRPTG